MDGPGSGDDTVFSPDVLRKLIDRLERTDVDELEITSGTSRLILRREPGKRTQIAPREGDVGTSRADGVPIAAPLTGVFYARPAPDQPPYAVPGTTIEQGQIVALIETMKLFNEVTSDIAGEVVSVVVEQGALVEAGQPLMFVVPRTQGEEP